MTTTSGDSLLHASTTELPSETAPTTSIPVLHPEEQLERLPEDVVVLDEQDAQGLRPIVHGRHLKRSGAYSAERSSG